MILVAEISGELNLVIVFIAFLTWQIEGIHVAERRITPRTLIDSWEQNPHDLTTSSEPCPLALYNNHYIAR